MTNTDQSNQSATSPTNSEAVRSGDWVAEWERRADMRVQRVDRPQQRWAVVGKWGYIGSIHTTRKEAIRDTVEGSTLTWLQWKRKYGLRAVKVVVEVLRPIVPDQRAPKGDVR